MRIRQIALIMAAILVLLSVPVCAEGENVFKEYYVSVSGNDINPGTKEQPFATLERAKEAVKEISSNMNGDIVVNIGAGTYYLSETLDFATEDSGKNGFSIIYRGEKESMPVISGGRKVTGFVESAEHPGIYQAEIKDIDRISQIYVNGKRRHIAKAGTMVTGVRKPEKYDTEEWYSAHPGDVVDDHYNFYDVNTEYSYDGFYMSKEDIGFYENPEDLLFMWDFGWKSHVMPVEAIETNPDNSDQVIVRMENGLWNFAIRKNASVVNYPRPERPFTMMNAMELLDEPGEFYYNRKTGVLYYMPYSDEKMTSAEVIVPVHEHIMLVCGNDVDEKVENISFENIRFAHTAWNAWQEGIITQQGTATNCTNEMIHTFIWPNEFGGGATVSAGIIMQMANNVNFKGNHIFGFGGAGIDAPNGVTNCNFTGNAFSDLGEGAFFLGSTVHTDTCIGKDGVSDAPTDKTKLFSLTDMLYYKLSTSYLSNWNESGTGHKILSGRNLETTEYPDSLYKTWVDEFSYKNAWKSDPKAPEKGEKSWVRYDFMRKYSIDEIVLAFDSDYVTDAEKSGFEVLLSNDKSFKEGNYTVVAKQETAAAELQKYTVSTDEKYQYLMIRTINPTPLAISRVWAFTSDLEPATKYERCKNINFTNNYIDRIGVDIHRATAVFMPYGENVKMLHNEVTDTGYSGFGLGWSWSRERYGARNNDFSYNKISDTTQTMHDGGGLYTLGRQENTTITHNFIDGNGVGRNAYYSDNGTAGVIYEYNAAENCTYTFFCNSGARENIYRNNYSTTPTYKDSDGMNEFEALNEYVAGMPTKGAYAIIKEAGLEAQYEHIRDWVKDEENNLYDKQLLYTYTIEDYTARKGASVTEANGMINSEAFGTGLGKFSIKDKYRLQNALEGLNNATESEKIAKLLELEAVIRDVKENVNRHSLSETFDILNETLSNARVVSDGCPCLSSKTKIGVVDTMGMDLASSVNTLQNTVKLLEEKRSNVITKEDEYDLLLEAEKAYNDFMSKRLSGDIAYVYADDAVDVTVNKNTANVCITFPYGTDITNKSLEVIPDGGAKVAIVIEDKVDLSVPLNIPLYCKGNDSYKYWTISAKYETASDSDITKSSAWFTKANLKNAIKKANDFTVLSANPYCYMTDSFKETENGILVNFEPVSPNDMNKFTFIIGADIFDGLDKFATDEKNDRCEISFNGTEASLYTVSKGSKKLIKTVDTGLLYNSKNSFAYSLKKINDTTHILVKLNGETIFSEVLSISSDGKYFGCYSDKINIKIY